MHPTLITPLFPPTDLVIMSIRAPYAEAILAGRKQVELRRVAPQFPIGLRILIYQPSPVQAIWGSFTVEGVVCGTPGALWTAYERSCGISEAAYHAYFAGASRAYGILVADPHPWPHPLTRRALQSIWPGFRPPQSYLFVRPRHPAYSVLTTIYVGTGASADQDGAPNTTPPARHSSTNPAWSIT